MSRIHFTNWEKRYAYEKDKNRVVNITSEIAIDKRAIKSVKGGIYDKNLGIIIDSDKDIREFSCDCGSMYGRFYEGEMCEECNTLVTEQYGVDIRRLGWIDVAPYFIINPNAFEIIKKVVGSKNLPKIISYNIPINLDGFPQININSTILYQDIGLLEFKNKFVEIVSKYGQMRGYPEETTLLIQEFEKGAIFSTKIPVMSVYLRPTFVSSKKKNVSHDMINEHYQKIIANAKLLQKNSTRKNKSFALGVLVSIQDYLQELYKFIITSKLSGKTKLIRSSILGSRLSYSARFVIASLNGEFAGLDHVILPYKGFIELYYFEIVNCMLRGMGDQAFKNMTIYEIYEYLTKVKFSNVVDEKIYFIIEEIIRQRGDTLRVIINRNPTLDLGSMQCMKIVHVTKDANNLIMYIPLTSLKSMCADFDGDVLNVFALKEKCVIDAFDKGFNPRYLVIDRSGDNYFNSDFGLIKDQLTSLFTFATPIEDIVKQ